jgi:hypothetical protein
MARKFELIDDISVNYRKIQQIVIEVTRKYGADLVLNLPRPTDEISF